MFDLIDKQAAECIKVNKVRLHGSISRATGLTDDKNNRKLSMYTDGKNAVIEAVGDVGSALETIPLESITAPMARRNLSGNRLKSIVYAISGDEVVIKFGEPLKPMLVHGTGVECVYMFAAMR